MTLRSEEVRDPQCKAECRDSIVAIVGNPNVGKSVLFHRLTGRYVTVSNYPGTTVEVCKGGCQLKDKSLCVIDTPGMYGLNPFTEEERVARRLLKEAKPDLVLHVVDAKNLRRMLPLTVQLIEAGFKVVLVLNMMDELERAGMSVNTRALSEKLGIPVAPTACIVGRGVCGLQDIIHEQLRS